MADEEKNEETSDVSRQSSEEPQEDTKRRGSAETTTAKEKETVPAPRNEAGQVEVRARAKYVRSAPRKARLVMEHIRGKPVADARAILDHTPRAVSRDVLKLLNSAVANAENNFELVADDLKVSHAYVDEGPTIKRYQPRALGRATRINKRTSHMTITLTTTEDEE
jgi:ribosomal protein L22